MMDVTQKAKHRWQQQAPQERTVLVGVHLPEAWAGGLGGEADVSQSLCSKPAGSRKKGSEGR